jgi:hypothetical protein
MMFHTQSSNSRTWVHVNGLFLLALPRLNTQLSPVVVVVVVPQVWRQVVVVVGRSLTVLTPILFLP